MPIRSHSDRAKELSQAIDDFEQENGLLPGLSTAQRRATWIAQIISSLRRIDYVRGLLQRPIEPSRCDPHDILFDPIKAAAYLGKQGQRDEAVWMTFVATHFGKHLTDGWKLASKVIGSFDQGPVWTVAQYGSNQPQFEQMLQNNRPALEDMGISGRFSNHRQYQSKKPEIISAVFRTFHDWLYQQGGFDNLIHSIHIAHGQEPTGAFDALYRSLDAVFGFGRLGKFDFLTMVAKLELAPIEAGSTYMVGATGPLSGAKLLFHNDTKYKVTAAKIGPQVDGLDDYLKVGKQ
ncbi:hypothetical protein [Neorhizobium tomejilense]|uniref:alpha-glutamyl/putrescinyl thymine pyrophosphorylase clade 3 protein n=1 Tax=Neorhizobium tomejilense TaxID=2093828 RepID=UPI00155E2166|nr:hypothetical protein [Neorhizobium tomejilense]